MVRSQLLYPLSYGRTFVLKESTNSIRHAKHGAHRAKIVDPRTRHIVTARDTIRLRGEMKSLYGGWRTYPSRDSCASRHSPCQRRKLARVSADPIAVVGAVALLMALAQLTMGVAWTLLIGGAVLLIGAITTLRVLRQAAPTRPSGVAPSQRPESRLRGLDADDCPPHHPPCPSLAFRYPRTHHGDRCPLH